MGAVDQACLRLRPGVCRGPSKAERRTRATASQAQLLITYCGLIRQLRVWLRRVWLTVMPFNR